MLMSDHVHRKKNILFCEGKMKAFYKYDLVVKKAPVQIKPVGLYWWVRFFFLIQYILLRRRIKVFAKMICVDKMA